MGTSSAHHFRRKSCALNPPRSPKGAARGFKMSKKIPPIALFGLEIREKSIKFRRNMTIYCHICQKFIDFGAYLLMHSPQLLREMYLFSPEIEEISLISAHFATNSIDLAQILDISIDSRSTKISHFQQKMKDFG